MKFVSWSMLFLLLISCKREKELTHADLTGTWHFANALRNGKPTRMLDQAFFVFHPDKSITSNLFATDERKTFDIVNNELSVTGKEAFKMEVSNFRKDTMELVGKMGPFDMEFLLIRSVDSLPEK